MIKKLIVFIILILLIGCSEKVPTIEPIKPQRIEVRTVKPIQSRALKGNSYSCLTTYGKKKIVCETQRLQRGLETLNNRVDSVLDAFGDCSSCR